MAKAYCTGYFTGKVSWLPIDPRNFSTLSDLQYTVFFKLYSTILCLYYSGGGGVSEKMLLAEADFFEQVPPNDHIINYFLTFISKGRELHTIIWHLVMYAFMLCTVGEGAITILELAKYGDLYSFLCAKKKAMVTQADKIWPKIDKGYMQMCAYATPTPPKLSVNISKLLDCYETSRPFNDLLSQPLSELDFLVFAHQIAAGLQHLSLHNVRR